MVINHLRQHALHSFVAGVLKKQVDSQFTWCQFSSTDGAVQTLSFLSRSFSNIAPFKCKSLKQIIDIYIVQSYICTIKMINCYNGKLLNLCSYLVFFVNLRRIIAANNPYTYFNNWCLIYLLLTRSDYK